MHAYGACTSPQNLIGCFVPRPMPVQIISWFYIRNFFEKYKLLTDKPTIRGKNINSPLAKENENQL